jgi:hypothetical protein
MNKIDDLQGHPKNAREVDLENALEKAKKQLCRWCREGDPMSLDEDGTDRKGHYHSFFGGNKICHATFIQDVLPSKKGNPLRSDSTLEKVGGARPATEKVEI